jgi:hypothetical protein
MIEGKMNYTIHTIKIIPCAECMENRTWSLDDLGIRLHEFHALPGRKPCSTCMKNFMCRDKDAKAVPESIRQLFQEAYGAVFTGQA